MSNSNQDEIDMLAAEYVLGTLEDAMRHSIAARRAREPSLDQAIDGWEHRLTSLALSTKSVEPPADLFIKVLRRIETSAADSAKDKVVQLTRRLRRWRQFAMSASALAASLLVFIVIHSFSNAQPQQFVAVLQQSDTSPAFLISVDLKTRELSVRPVAAPAQQGKSYELWIVNDKLGAPRSLGVVDTHGVSVHPALARYDSTMVRNSVYAISLEPEGGSPTGHATGPVLYTGKLLELAD